MRACVKYFAKTNGRKNFGSMYEDTDFGKDIHAGDRGAGERHEFETWRRPRSVPLLPISTRTSAGSRMPAAISSAWARSSGTRSSSCKQRAKWVGTWTSAASSRAIPLPLPRLPGDRRTGSIRCRLGSMLIPTMRDRRCARYGPLQAALRHRHQLPGRSRICSGECLIEVTAAGGSRPEFGHVPEVDGKHHGLARHVRWSAADDHSHRSPCLDAVVPSVVKKTRWTPVVAEPLGY